MQETVIEKLTNIEKLLLSQKTVFNIQEVAEYTGLSVDYIYKLTHKQIIPFSKPNGKLLFFEKARIDKWLTSNPSKTIDEIELATANYLTSNRGK